MTIRPLLIFRFAGITMLLGHLLVWYPLQVTRTDYAGFGLDIELFHRAAIKVAHHQPIYGETRASVSQPHGAFFYPPTFAVMIRPAAALSIATVAKIWYAAILVAYWMFAWALARIAFPYRCHADHVLAIGTFLQLIPHLYLSMGSGNVDLVVWALVAWAISARRVAVAVALLLLASWIKVYPIFGIPILLLRHAGADSDRDQSRPFRAAIGVFVAGLLGTVAVIAMSGYGPEWIRVGIPSVSAGCLYRDNFSLTTLAIRPFVDSSAPTLPHWAQRFLSIAPLVGIAGVAIATTRRLGARPHAAVVVTAALWLSPICWIHQIGFASIVLALWWAHRYSSAPASLTRR